MRAADRELRSRGPTTSISARMASIVASSSSTMRSRARPVTLVEELLGRFARWRRRRRRLGLHV